MQLLEQEVALERMSMHQAVMWRIVIMQITNTVSYLMDRLDEKYDRFSATSSLSRPPSEYIRENFWFVMDPGERSIDAQCDLVGEDKFLWGSDYPHVDSHMTAMAELHQALAPMSEQRRNLVLGGNARKLFNL